MLNSKGLLGLLGILLLGLAASASVENNICLGKDIVDIANTFAEKEKCWFSDNHLYLIKFKLQLMNSTAEQLEKLVNASNVEAPTACQAQMLTRVCAQEDGFKQANCLINYIQYLTVIYNSQETCSGKILDAKQMDLVCKFMSGVMAGWKQIHTTC